ncbi:hypothetical protein QFC21_006749 [Naganishia friedmannii]|uniref:Uncharacterized protein n=1 Tax=Naganishia friedmannii TaxID=89922 RepID=A0ACC2V0S3_9TREE|nr:hypothetical protein QFC21_006749 [Naganishia friedmannii]
MGRHPREASGGVFQMFTPPQIKQFREAFMLIDTDGDGKITEDDLITTFGNLGQTPTKKTLESLLARPSGSTSTSGSTKSINFTQFLTMFGTHLLDLADSEHEILDAFACFDEFDAGVVDLDRFFSGPFMDKKSQKFDYVRFAKTLKVNDAAEVEDDEEKQRQEQ